MHFGVWLAEVRDRTAKWLGGILDCRRIFEVCKDIRHMDAGFGGRRWEVVHNADLTYSH
jgi:hypothetical protein